MKPVVLNFKSGAISHWAYFGNVTSNCSVHLNLAHNERWELNIQISLEPLGIYNNVGVYFYIFMDILGIQHDLG